MVKHGSKRRYGYNEKTDLIEKTINDDLLPVYGKMRGRQIYYQLVTRNILSNTHSESNDFSQILCKLRRTGRVDPAMILDSSRRIDNVTTFMDPTDFLDCIQKGINIAVRKYQTDLWSGQPHKVIIILEKESLCSGFEIAQKYQVPVVIAKGFGSDPQIYELKQIVGDQLVKVLMFSDHDPAGLCATDPNIKNSWGKRLRIYGVNVLGDPERIALTDAQIKDNTLPSNPDKATLEKLLKDTNGGKYGITKVCELDALEPQVLQKIIEDAIKAEIMWDKLWDLNVKQLEAERKILDAYLKTIVLKLPP